MIKKMKIVDNNNVTDIYDVLCTFDSDLTNKSYIVYTNDLKSKNNKLELQAGSYTKKEDYYEVNNNLTNNEYEMVSEVMDRLINK